MGHSTSNRYQGQTVNIIPNGTILPEDLQYTVWDWVDILFGQSWQDTLGVGNVECDTYAERREAANLPLDDDVVFGATNDGVQRILHDSELGEPIDPAL